jgi:hypothetical protein
MNGEAQAKVTKGIDAATVAVPKEYAALDKFDSGQTRKDFGV